MLRRGTLTVHYRPESACTQGSRVAGGPSPGLQGPRDGPPLFCVHDGAVGVWWDWLSGRDVRQWGRKILRLKFPYIRGFSRDTYDALASGDLEIVDDDPQLDLIMDDDPQLDQVIIEPGEGE